MPHEHPAVTAAREAVEAARERVCAAEYGTPAYCRAKAAGLRAAAHEAALFWAGAAAAWDALAKRPDGVRLESDAAQAVWNAGYLAGIDALDASAPAREGASALDADAGVGAP